MTAYVADASVLFKTLVEEPDSRQAETLLSRAQIVVPEIVYAEVANALWARVHDRRLSAQIAAGLMQDFASVAFEVHSPRLHIQRALNLATILDHPVYDCIYLALAEKLGLALVTTDRRFITVLRRARLQSVDIKTLSDLF
jgi:predicted nucleic acid-binding protein